MIGYCTNVHAGETLDQVIHNLQHYSAAVQKKVGDSIGVGLWLANETLGHETSNRLHACVEELGLAVNSINGFPYGNFHKTIVGRDVYKPTWQEEDRLRYTTQLASILASLLPEHRSGSISTLPIGWGSTEQNDPLAALMLTKCVDFLDELEQTTNRLIHLDIEPEPGCRLQSADDLAQFIQKQFGDDERIRKYIRVCYDTCHAAVMREDPVASLDKYKQAGLTIGKVQLSSAIDVQFETLSKDERTIAAEALRTLAEPRYLHQTTVVEDGEMTFYENLPNAQLDSPSGHWRVHFHVPIHKDTLGPLGTTQADLIQTIKLLPISKDTQWEVETYTWDVMPTQFQDSALVASICSEINWAIKQIQRAPNNE